MPEHPIFSEDLLEIVESFVIETKEIFEELDIDLLQLEQGTHDQALVDQIFRAVHTVKGTSGFLSLEQMSVLAHHFEDVLNRLRRGELTLAPGMMDVMFDAFDLMKVLLAQVEHRDFEWIELDAIIAQLKSISEGTFVAGAAPATTAKPAAPTVAEAAAKQGAKDAAARNFKPPVFSEDLLEIVESFVIETKEIFEELDIDLLQLEQGTHDQALVDQIFRAVHTVKGTSGFLSLEQMSVLAHHFEDVLNRLRRGELTLAPGMMDVVFDAFDLMKVLLAQVEHRDFEWIDLDAIIAQLKSISEGTFVAGAAPAPSAKPAAPTVAEAAPEAVTEAVTEAPNAEAADTPKKKAASSGRSRNGGGETIRVDVARLDALMDLVGELVLGRNRLIQLIHDVQSAGQTDESFRQLVETSTHVDFLTTELQTAVMNTRMVQIGRVFNKFPRVMRDLAKEFEKQINLVLEGQDTEVDKSLIEEISDPLVHLIRNAADHGVELPADRVAAGKPAEGTVTLRAAHEGNQIVISIQDDGAGMDPERLKQHAINKRVLTEKEAAEMKDVDAYNLIFRPGFSTAKKVSQVSGRGVGMDVVKTNITRLNGTITIDSAMGKGTCFTLKLPLTLAITRSLLVRVAEESFAVPLHSVIEVVGLEDSNVQTIHGREVIRLREQVVPLTRISDVLSVPAKATEDASARKQTYAVIIGIAHHRLGLIVDDLLGQKEIVVKPLGAYLKKTKGIAGSTILGDGRVVMILDVGEVVRLESERLRGHRLAA